MRILFIVFDPTLFGLAAIFFSVIWMVRNEKDKSRPLLVFAILINLFFGTLLKFSMGREGALLPWKYDHVLLRMDASLGLSAAAVARQLQNGWQWPLFVIYELMVPMMICWFLVTRRRNDYSTIIRAYVVELVAGPLLYAIVPASGPLYAFGKQWLHPPPVAAAPVQLAGFPNAFPSLHVATAMVFVLFAPGRFWRGVSLVFLASTMLATLSTGEHYVIDLIPGLACGCFVTFAAFKKIRPSMIYLGIVLAWSIGMRFIYAFLIAHPVIAGSFAVVTVAASALGVVKMWSVSPLCAVNVRTAHSESMFVQAS